MRELIAKREKRASKRKKINRRIKKCSKREVGERGREVVREGERDKGRWSTGRLNLFPKVR